MKRIISLALALALLLPCLAAQAETVIKPLEDRGIVLQPVGENTVEEGISPTTGLFLADYDVPNGFKGLAADGRYQPMLVQIDNTGGGTGNTAPWGASYADVVYETPLHSGGFTRISFLFSDLIPNSVGPIRSARVGHCLLREEWDAGFLFYGGQKREGSNIEDIFREYKATSKGVIFSGTDGTGKAWKAFYNRRVGEGIQAPSNVDADVAAISELVPSTLVPPNHAYLFTDDLPEGEPANEVYVYWNQAGYNSVMRYDEDSNLYTRSLLSKDTETYYEDRDSMELITFANVIIQFTNVSWNGSAAAPVTQHVGEGNADFFMGGVHIAGYWKREDTTENGVKVGHRTVFYAPDGTEMPMQRGRTLIVIFPNKPYSSKMKNMRVAYQ